MKRAKALLLVSSLGIAASGLAWGGDFAYTTDARGFIDHSTVVDARAQSACLKRTVAGARCLPAADFLGPHGRLAAFPDVYWLLGTAGIAARDAVLVVGDDPIERDFVAGMLYLSGQSRVMVLNQPISGGAGLPVSRLGPGAARGMLRQPIYEGTAREGAMLLRSELAAEIQRAHAPVLLDGRPAAAYWGETVRALRGGHLPGAQSLPMTDLRAEIGKGQAHLPPGPFVVYGHDPFESVAYFTLARAGAGADARVLLDGWAAWANNPGLPVDAETYRDGMKAMTALETRHVPRSGAIPAKGIGAAALGLLILMTGSWYLGRLSKK